MANRPKFAALAVLSLATAFPATYRFGALWDGDKLTKNVCLTTQAAKIQSVGPCAGDSVDLSRYTAIPGLIDAHTHLTYILDNPVNQSGRSAAVVFLSQENAR
jgi:imidazolonepropionase-like amidohydrolase